MNSMVSNCNACKIIPTRLLSRELTVAFGSIIDGLYVLLPPDKGMKRKKNDLIPVVPKHLEHLVMKEVPPETCAWQLSGPQFPKPTAIQQRYAYPKGREQYSARKGAALWTMCDADHKTEHREFRLLHVYFSPKRATNNGCKSSAKSITKKRASPKRKQVKPPYVARSPHRPISYPGSFAWTGPPTPYSPLHAYQNPYSSPLSFEIYQADQLRFSEHPGTEDDSNTFVTPLSSNTVSRPRGRSKKDNDDEDYFPDDEESSTFSFLASDEVNRPSVQPEQSRQSLGLSSSLKEIDEFWNPGMEFDTSELGFASRLEQLQSSLVNHCLEADIPIRERLVSMLQNWAMQLAQNPLEPPGSKGDDGSASDGCEDALDIGDGLPGINFERDYTPFGNDELYSEALV